MKANSITKRIFKGHFTLYRQLETIDCGPACLQMVAAHFGKNYMLSDLKDRCNLTRVGVSVKNIVLGAKSIGLHAVAVKANLYEIKKIPMPAILHWRQNHFVVLYAIKSKGSDLIFHIADPAFGKVKLDEQMFVKEWLSGEYYGIAVAAAPTLKFDELTPVVKSKKEELDKYFKLVKENFSKYHKSFISSILLSFLLIVTTWAIPYFFQRTIDEGISNKDINIVILLMLGQLTFFFGYTLSNILIKIIMTKAGFKISVGLLTDFLYKIIRLPLSFFDSKVYTDIIQRMDDQVKIESFLTNSMIVSLFAIIQISVFSFMLIYYNLNIFFIFFLFTGLSIIYSVLFWGKRKIIDYSKFATNTISRNKINELLNGMAEIKINSAQNTKITQWKETQNLLNDLSLKSLYLTSAMDGGTVFFDKLKDIIITAGCAFFVIEGNMTIGIMLTITYIIGQLSNTTSQIILQIRIFQDTKLSYDRLDEIYSKKDEDDEKKKLPAKIKSGISFENVYFKYDISSKTNILTNINLQIPKNKITAIVGNSGSGKTTLMKLMLSFYNPQEGYILLDGEKMVTINADEWRRKCGVVMQDGYIFSGAILDNIAIADPSPNKEMVKQAAKIACIDEFIESIPMKYNTKIGNAGINLSGGQKQRILIARAVYKNPEFIFFDEATSFLDSNTEYQIINNLNEFYKNRSVVIIAHRLSTVKNADNIIFIDKGEIIEQGSHSVLYRKRGAYYKLVENQLELDSGLDKESKEQRYDCK